MKILVLNSGSSRQKACLYEIGATLPELPPTCLWEGKIERDRETAAMRVKNSEGHVLTEQLPVTSRERVIRHLPDTLFVGTTRAVAEALAFTAGVGENSPEVREAATRRFEFLGLTLDSHANRQPCLDRDIATPDSHVRVLVIRAEEDWAIAQECWKLVQRTAQPVTAN